MVDNIIKSVAEKLSSLSYIEVGVCETPQPA